MFWAIWMGSAKSREGIPNYAEGLRVIRIFLICEEIETIY